MLLYETHTKAVTTVAFSPDGTALVTGSADGSLVLREMDGRVQPLLESGPKSPAVHAVAHLADGPAVVIGHALGWHIYRRDADTWRMFAPPAAAPTTALAVLDETTLAVGTGDRMKPSAGSFELWDLPTGKRFEPHFPEPNGVRAVAACPGHNLVAWATGHRKVSVWEITRQDPFHFPQAKNSPAIAFAPDGLQLAVAVDYEIRLYDLSLRRERLVLKGHKGQVTAVAFSPDGSTLATGSWDQTVRSWDAASGRLKSNFKWPIGRVCCLAYAPDGLRLAAGGEFGGIIVWDAE